MSNRITSSVLKADQDRKTASNSSLINLDNTQTGNEEIAEFLKLLKEFSGLPETDLQNLVGSARIGTFTPGQYITIEGEAESLYGFIVISGCLAMTKTSVNGKELIVELLQAGDIFGLLLMLATDKLPAQLSARAIQKTKVLFVPVNKFMQLLKLHPILFKEHVAHLLLCLHSSYQLSRGLAHDRVEVRIATVLSSLAIKFKQTASTGQLPIINFTRQQLADLTGTTSETAIRVTRSMQADGIIDTKRPGVICILNLPALHKLADL